MNLLHFFFCYYIGTDPRWRIDKLKNKAILSLKIGTAEVFLEMRSGMIRYKIFILQIIQVANSMEEIIRC